jgi:hypothetical protein
MGGAWPEDACALVIILNRASILTPTFAAIVDAIQVHFPHRFVCRQPREPPPGKRNFAPRDFGQKRRLLAPGDRQISSRDWTSSRQPAELSGFFKPVVVLPVRGDWLVVDAVVENRSPLTNLAACREFCREFVPIWAKSQPEQITNSLIKQAFETVFEQIPWRSVQGIARKRPNLGANSPSCRTQIPCQKRSAQADHKGHTYPRRPFQPIYAN